jgi:hypothetical protein
VKDAKPAKDCRSEKQEDQIKGDETGRAALKFGFVALPEETSQSRTWRLLRSQTTSLPANYVKPYLYVIIAKHEEGAKILRYAE